MVGPSAVRETFHFHSGIFTGVRGIAGATGAVGGVLSLSLSLSHAGVSLSFSVSPCRFASGMSMCCGFFFDRADVVKYVVEASRDVDVRVGA